MKKKISENIKCFYHTSKGFLLKFMIFFFVVGMSISILEIALSFCLLNFLHDFKILPDEDEKKIPFLGNNPTMELIICSIFLYFAKYLNLLLPPIIFQNSVCSLRELLVKKAFLGLGDNSYFSLPKCNHLITNVIQKTSSFKVALIRFITYTFTSLTIFGSLLILSFELTLVLLLFLISVSLIFYLVKRQSSEHVNKIYESNMGFIDNFTKNYKNLTFIKISGINEYVKNILTKTNNDLLSSNKKFQSLFMINAVIPNILGLLFIIFLVILNYRLGYVEVSTLVPFIYLLSRVAVQLSEISQSYTSLFYCYPEFNEFSKIYQILFKKEKVKELPNINTDLIKIENFSFEIKKLSFGRNEVLGKDISFKLSRGNLILIKGESGSGKSTLLNTILGMLPKKSGEILISGKRVNINDIRKYKKLIFYTGTDPFLINGTIMENLLLGNNNPNSENIKVAIKTCELDFVKELKLKYQTPLGDDGTGISSGQKQKISLARALIRNPYLLVLDEALSNMDKGTELRICKNLLKNYPYMSKIVVSHRETLDNFADKIIKL